MAARPPPPELAEWLARLAPLGELSARRMFGAHGLYCDGVFFGLVDEGVLYFKVDATTVAAYRARGAGPFRPYRERPEVAMHGYHEVPEGVLERDDEFRAWARAAIEVGKANRPRARRPARRRARATEVPVGELPNLGPKSAAWLREIGIENRADLARVGSVRAYRELVAAGRTPSLNLLYALEGALLDLRWDRLSAAVKENLRVRAGRG